MSVEYISPNYTGHHLFHTAETLGLVAIIGDGIENWQGTITKIVTEITGVSISMGTFLSAFVSLLIGKYIGLSDEQFENSTIAVPDGPPINTVRLQFFCTPFG